MKKWFLLLACAFLAAGVSGCAFVERGGESGSSEVSSSQPASVSEEAGSPESVSAAPSVAASPDAALLAEDFLSRPEDVDRFEMYFQILASYVYEPCTSAELESHQMIDPAIFMCGGNSAEVDEETGLMTLDQQDVTAWAEKLFGKPIDFDQLDEEYGYDFYLASNRDDHTITAHTFTDTIAVRGYGVSIDALHYQADGRNFYVVAPILKIEDRGIWEPYQTLRYGFVVMETETGTPCYLLQNVEKYAEEE